MSRWIREFTARSPKDPIHSQWTVGLSEAKFRLLQQKGHDCKLARLRIVARVLADHTLLIGGWNRPDTEDCFVYVGKPEIDYRSLTIEAPAPKGMLFLVFVLPDGTIDDWNWRQASEDDPNMPMDVKGTLLWPLTQT